MMASTDMTKQAVDDASAALYGKGPVQMVNLLRFRDQAHYADGSDLPPASGMDVYMTRYVPAFAEVAAKMAPGEAFSPVFLGGVAATLVAEPGEAWHAVAIVQYKTFESLKKVIDSLEYEQKAAPHRRAALADWRFIATQTMDLPA